MRLFSKKIKKWLFYLSVIAAGCFLLFLLLDAIFPVSTHIEYSQVIEARDGTILHAYLTSDDQWRMKTELSEITPQLKKAILFKEDKYFYYHPGINPAAVCRALWNNLIHHRRTSGASTITMQVARLLDPKSRTYGNKLVEMFRALQLEWHFSKNQILLLYLNLVPYGSNIEGVKAAAELYFNKSPDQLSLAQLTALSVIPNRPNSLQIGKDNLAIEKERNKWLHRFARADLFPKAVIHDALREPLTAYRHDAPSLAPHFCERMHEEYPDKSDIKTTLDLSVQYKAETLVKNYVSKLRQQNIHNAAVMIMNNKTHAVIGYVGSADFNDLADDGQVDGIQAIRSPGSTLKPLLYGMAFDEGLITPKSVIADVPVNFKGYAPEDYDQHFNGDVTIEYALENSLNIPAVKILNDVGVNNFINRLTTAGFSEITTDSKNLGLSMILGGCGVRLDEMVPLYSALADNGRLYPLEWLKKDSLHSKKSTKSNQHIYQKILTPAAAFLVTNILTKLTRPDLPNNFENSDNLPQIAWKTGTSYGRRDTWSIGYNRDYTIGVWVGNFSGQGVPDLSGASVATPLLFSIFNVIDYNQPKDWFSPPPTVSFRLVCAVTGKVPNSFCKQQVMDYYIPGVSSNAVCDHLKKVWVSPDGKISYCTACRPATGYITKWYPNISPELAAYYDAHHIPYEKIPPHNPACDRVFSGASPVITSLQDGLEYIVEKNEKQQLMLACTTANDVKNVYWYVNNRFLCKATTGKKIFFVPKATNIKISCTDDKGRDSDIYVKVKFI